MEEPKLSVTCTPFNAKLTERGCQANQKRATTTANRLLNGMADDAGRIEASDLEALAGCGQCARCNPELQYIFREAIPRAIEKLADFILDDNYTTDPEKQRAKRLEAVRKYNAKPGIMEGKREYLREQRAKKSLQQ